MACNINFNQLRSLAIVLQERVDTLYSAINAIRAITHPWVLNSGNEYLPAVAAVKQQAAAYKLLSVPQITLNDTIRELDMCIGGAFSFTSLSFETISF